MATNSQDPQGQQQRPPPPRERSGTGSHDAEDTKLEEDEIFIDDMSINMAIDDDGNGYAKLGMGEAPGLPSQTGGYYPLYPISQLKQVVEAHETKRQSNRRWEMQRRALASLITTFQTPRRSRRI
jgi:hypothetical protein